MMKKKHWISSVVLAAALCASTGLSSGLLIDMKTETASADSSLQVFDENNIVLTAATITDPHIGYVNSTLGVDNAVKFNTTLSVLKDWAGEDGIDMFISAGDNTQNGIATEATAFMDILAEYLAPTEVPALITHGNHDVYWSLPAGSTETLIRRGGFYEIYNQYGVYNHDVGMGQEDTEEDRTAAINQASSRGNRHLEVNGYHFLAVDINSYGNGKNDLIDVTETWLKDKLDTISANNPNEPIFVVSHTPGMNTIYGSITADAGFGDITKDDDTALWGGSVELDAILQNYPQVINISGHTHYASNHDLAIMQTSYTSFTPGGAADLVANKDTVETANGTIPDARLRSQAALVQIDKDNNVRITRIDCVKNEEIGEAWIIPAPQEDGSHLEPYSYKRGETNEAPVISVENFSTYTDRANRVVVNYKATDDGLVYSYRLTLRDSEGNIISEVTKLSPWIDYPNPDDIPDTLSYIFEGVTYDSLYTVEVVAIDCWAKESEAVTKNITDSAFEVLDSTSSLNGSDETLSYDISTKTGTVNIFNDTNTTTDSVTKWFSYQMGDMVTTKSEPRALAGLAAQYTVTYTDISTLGIADSHWVGVAFKVDNYYLYYRVGSTISYGGYDYLGLGKDESSPFGYATSSSGAIRPLTTQVVTEENPSAKIVFTFVPKVGVTNGLFTVTVNGVLVGTYDYDSTSLPQMGLYAGENTANISDASIKILKATGWHRGFDVLEMEDVSFDNSASTHLSYDLDTKTGTANASGTTTEKFFTYEMPEYVNTNTGVKPLAGMSVEYSVEFSDIGVLDTIADTSYVGVMFTVDGYTTKYRVGSKLNYGASDYFWLGKDESSPFGYATSSSGAIRPLTSLVVTEDNPSAKIVFIFTPKVGDVSGSYSITVNGVSVGTYVYESTSLPTMGLIVGKNTADISNASIKILGALSPVEDLDILEEDGTTFDNSSNLSYDVATKTGTANASTATTEKFFTYDMYDYVDTATGVKPLAGMSVEYSVEFSNISVLDTIADTSYVGVMFKVDGYTLKYRVGSKLNYGGSDYLPLGTDVNSPFVTDTQSGNKRPLTSVVVTEENPSAKIVFTFVPKVGDVNGSFTITVNDKVVGTYIYESTSLPQMGLLVGKNTANISNASIKVLGALDWYKGLDLLQQENATFDSNALLMYYTDDNIGIANSPTSVTQKYFNYDVGEYAETVTGLRATSEYTAVYSVLFSNIEVLDKADTAYIGVLFKVDGYEMKYRVGSLISYGGYDHLSFEGGMDSPFVSEGQSTTRRDLTQQVITEENRSAKIVFTFVPKVGDVNGSFTIVVNDVTVGTYVYESTTFPVMGLQVNKNVARISNASAMLYGDAIGWHQTDTELNLTGDTTATAGTKQTVTATLAPAEGWTSVPTGYVQFYLNGNAISKAKLENGVATATFLAMENGEVTAEYMGDVNYYSDESAYEYTVSVTDVLETIGARMLFAERSGLRFENLINQEYLSGLDSLVEAGEIQGYSMGTLMLPEKGLGENEELTHDTTYVRDVVRTTWASDTSTETMKGFSAVLLGIPVQNKTAVIRARAYITIQVSGTESYTYYADYCDRSIAEIADAIIETEGEYESLKPTYQQIVDMYATISFEEVQ